MEVTQPYLLVGQEPNEATKNHPNFWLLPDMTGKQHSANRLLLISKYSITEYLALFERTNLWPCSNAVTKAHTLVLRARAHQQRILLLGKSTAAPFELYAPAGYRVSNPEFLIEYRSPPSDLEVRVWIVPHPSGRNRWWNKLENCALAYRFFAQRKEDAELRFLKEARLGRR